MVGKNKKRTLCIILAILFAGMGGFWVYRTYTRDSGKNTDSINYDPPTKNEREVGNQQKEEIVQQEEQDKQQQEQTAKNPTKKKTVSVIITDAGEYDGIIEVRSFIPDHFQNGTCTVTFTQGSKTVTKETPARTDVSTTICMNPLIKRSELPASGTWQVRVAYTSAGATGTSDPQTLTLH